VPSLHPRLLLGPGLVLFYFFAFQGGWYYHRATQELGLAAIAALYLYCVIATGLQNPAQRDYRWEKWAWGAPLFVLGFVSFYALLFSVHTDANPVPGMLALRYYAALLVVPVLFLSYKLGVSIQTHERILFVALVLLLLNYTFNYFRIDPTIALHSEDHTIRAIVTYDEWRGYRLKPNYYSFYLLTFLGFLLAFRPGYGWLRPLGLAAALSCVFWLGVLRPRAGLLGMTFAALSYGLFLARSARLGMLFTVAPIALVTAALFLAANATAFVDSFRNDWSFIARLQSYRIALSVIQEYPLFGFGQASYYSLSYQDVFGHHFYPGDIGLVGVGFRNGLIGVAFYVGFHLYLVQHLVRVNWRYRRRHGRTTPGLVALTVLVIGLLPILPTQPAFAFDFGLPVAGISLGFAACCNDAARGI